MNDADVDFILKRFDQTPAHLQRRIVASFVSQVADYKELTADLLAACKEARQFIANAIEFGYCKEPEPGTRESKCLGVLDAAIAKAEGDSK